MCSSDLGYINNQKLGREALVASYCQEIHSNYRELLPRFCKEHGTRLFLAHDPASQSFLSRFFAEIASSDPQGPGSLLDHKIDIHRPAKGEGLEKGYDFNRIKTAVITHAQALMKLWRHYPHIRYRLLVLLPHPVDLVLESLSSSAQANAKWSHRKVFVTADDEACGFRPLSDVHHPHPEATHSFQEVLRSLHTVKQLVFVVRFHPQTRALVEQLGALIARFQEDPNVLFQPLQTMASAVDTLSAFLALSEIGRAHV